MDKDIHKNSIHFTAIYQDYNWCYQKFMVEGLNHEEMAKEAKCSKRVIEKWCCDKHRLTQKYRQKNKQINNIQRDLIIGSLLGDGHIDKRETQPLFIVSHAENQKDYLYWKYEILKDLCNIPPVFNKGKEVYFKTTEDYYNTQNSYRLCTRIHDCLKEYRNMSIKQLLDNLNNFSLSIWLLDDGYRGDSNWSICIASFLEDEKKYAIAILRNKFNLDCYVLESDNRYIHFRAESSRSLDKVILNNIPNDLDIIKYKIVENDKIKKPMERVYINIEGKDVLLAEYCRANNLSYKSIWSKYKDDIKLVI